MRTKPLKTKPSSEKRTALQLDKVRVSEGAELVKKIFHQQSHASDFAPIHRLAAHLDKIAGKTFEEFLELGENVREELRKAAEFIGEKFRKPQSLYGFLREIAGVLKKTASDIAQHAGRIALFLIAIVSPEKINDQLRSAYLFAR